VPNVFYGLQSICPGQVAIEGSGNTNVAMPPITGGGWYSGVTPTEPWFAINMYSARAQFAGSWFNVTVQAADLFGNFVGSSAPADRIRITSDDISILSDPGQGEYIEDVLVNGRAYYFAQLRTEGPRKINPYDIDNGSIIGDIPGTSTWSTVRIVQGVDTRFAAIVEGVAFEDSVPVYVEAAPNTFAMRVEVRYTSTNEVVSTAVPFVLEPMLNITLPLTPAAGALGITTGGTLFGTADIPLQSYNRAENIFIRVRNADGSNTPAAAFSPEVRVQASAPSRIRMYANTVSYQQGNDTYYQLQANNDTPIYAQVLDANDNPVPSKDVSMIIVNQAETNSRLDAPERTTTDSTGTAYRTFFAGANNLRHIIQASVGDVVGQLFMFVTVTQNGGVYPNPFNPLGGEAAHIDYPLDDNAPVKLFVYTLLGDLVWHKEFQAGDPEGGHAGVNSVAWDGKNDNGVMVANGGYICLIKVSDQDKFRFKIGVFKQK